MYHSIRVIEAATSAAPAQAAIRSGRELPTTGEIRAGCFMSQPRSTASGVVFFSCASLASSSAVARSAGAAAADGAPVYRP